MFRNKTHFTFFLLGVLIATLWGLWLLGGAGSGRGYVLSDPDAYLHMWNLWWVQHSLTQLQSPYTTTFIGFPDSISLTYHQLILPLGILSIPLFAVGLHAGQVLLFWQYVFLLIGFTGMYCLVSRFVDYPPAVCLAALYFVLTPIFWENLPRPDSLSYVVFPWFVLSIYWSQSGTRLRLLVPGVIGAFLVLMSPYYAAGWIGVFMFTLPFTETLSLRRMHLFCVLLFSLLFSGFEWIPQALGHGPNVIVTRGVIEAFSADLTAWFLPHPEFLWIPDSYAWWSDSWTAGIHSSIYLGWTAIFLGLIGLNRLEGKKRTWGLLLIGIMFLGALGPGIRFLGTTYGSGLLPFGWALNVSDSFRAFRIPLRFGYFVVFFLSIGVGLGLAEQRRWTAVLFLLLILELLRPPMKVRPLPEVDSLERIRTTVEEQALVPVPFSDWATEAQFGQTIHHKKFHLAGLSYIPADVWDQISTNPFLDALYNGRPLPDDGVDQLKRNGVGGVILHDAILSNVKRARLKRRLRQLFGDPILATRRFELYRFGPVSDESTRNSSRQP